MEKIENKSIHERFEIQLLGTIDLLFDNDYKAGLQMSDQMLDLYGPRHFLHLLRSQAQRGLGRFADAKESHKEGIVYKTTSITCVARISNLLCFIYIAALVAGGLCLTLSDRARECGKKAFAANDMTTALAYAHMGIVYNPCDMRHALNAGAALFGKGDFSNAEGYISKAIRVGLALKAPKALLHKAIDRRAAAHRALCREMGLVTSDWETPLRNKVTNMSVDRSCKGRQRYDEDESPMTSAEVEHTMAYHWAVWERSVQLSSDLAAVHYTAAIALSPINELSKLYADRAICYLRLHKFDDGLRDANCAVRLADKPDANAHWLVGLCWHGLSRFDKARSAFDEAIAIDPMERHVLSHQFLSKTNRVFFDTVLDRLEVSVSNNLTYYN